MTLRSCVALLSFASALTAATVDLRRAVVVVRPGDLPPAEKTAATVLVEELERRSGIRLPVATEWPADRVAIAITGTPTAWGRTVPAPPARPEAFRLRVEGRAVWIVGADARGALYGVGRLLRELRWTKGALDLDAPIDVSTSPALPIRGHQLGYRSTANSW